ncbi:MAG TPA: hypothetical protein GYA08_15975 [Chloroflexi bacterium]|nr:hypothetical protein [Chloroflexota bacterium]
MRIAFPTDDGVTIQRHFGRATHYAVITIENNAGAAIELRNKEAHLHGHEHDHEHHDHGHHHDHMSMFAPLADCQVLIAGHMGAPAYVAAQKAGLEVILTPEPTIERAHQAWLAGTLVNHATTLVHAPGHHHINR